MNPYITDITPLTVAGWTFEVPLPNVNRHADIPAFFWSELCQNEYNKTDSQRTYSIKEHFKKSNVIKHCEILLCYDSASDVFTYLYGRAIVHPDDLKQIPPDLKVVELNGLYAIFTTQPIPARRDDLYGAAIKELWHDIMNKWLPGSEFEYDPTRKDFEYYDIKDHGIFFDGNKKMDIYIPIRQREKAYMEAKNNGFDFVEVYT